MEKPVPVTQYKPSTKAIEILRLLYKSQDELTYTDLKRKTGLTGTGLSDLLNLLEGYDAILRPERRFKQPIHITEIGLYLLARWDQLRVNREDLDKQQSKDFLRVWKEVHAVHVKVLRGFGSKLRFNEKDELEPIDHGGAVKIGDWFVAAVEGPDGKTFFFKLVDPILLKPEKA
jgi:hypothetical protein